MSNQCQEKAALEVAASLAAERQSALSKRLPESYKNPAQKAILLEFVRWVRGKATTVYAGDTTGAAELLVSAALEAERRLARFNGGGHD